MPGASLSLRWRFRTETNIGTKFLHLVDSRVTLGVVAKGRTSSWRLRRALCKVNALMLAGFSTMRLGLCEPTSTRQTARQGVGEAKEAKRSR